MDFLISSTRNFFNLFRTRTPDQMATIQDISGRQYVRGTEAHTDASYQYATSTHKVDHDMNPALVIQPKNKNDIKVALKYAKENKIAVAIRTGGHQYSGASSTGGKNIQLDLERTFQGPDDRKIFIKDGETLVRTSVSWPLGSFNAWLTERGLFIPHGLHHSNIPRPIELMLLQANAPRSILAATFKQVVMANLDAPSVFSVTTFASSR